MSIPNPVQAMAPEKKLERQPRVGPQNKNPPARSWIDTAQEQQNQSYLKTGFIVGAVALAAYLFLRK